jgi:molybdenum cofactor guanylyltransferase
MLDEARLLQDPVLAAADPELDSVLNVNEPADYRAARALPAPRVTVTLPDGPRTVRAATVGEAAHAAGLAFGPDVAAALNGGRLTHDGATPLVAGDSVDFLAP